MRAALLGNMRSDERHPFRTPPLRMTPELARSCDCCRAMLDGGTGFQCAVCIRDPGTGHGHPWTHLHQSSSGRSKEEQMKMMQLWLTALAHAAACGGNSCGVRVCVRMKHLFHHIRHCQASMVEGDCRHCKTYAVLLRKHTKQCTDVDCPVPQCPGASESGDEGSVTSPDSASVRDDE
ncbi:hypothetical protein BSKO_11511 [Bryopsis sp. KO-2023]|nr:hypothetical protein BSKO_11511 [Bryopsis sp. KO-2023]